jgi:hypothetical protein
MTAIPVARVRVSRADELPDQHEEDRVADTEMRRDIGDGQNVEGHEAAAQKQVPRRRGQPAKALGAQQCPDRPGRQQRNAEQDHSRRRRRPEPLPQRRIERGQRGNADSRQQHDHRVLCHPGSLHDGR